MERGFILLLLQGTGHIREVLETGFSHKFAFVAKADFRVSEVGYFDQNGRARWSALSDPYINIVQTVVLYRLHTILRTVGCV